MILSMCSAPSSESWAPTGSRDPFSSRARARYRTSVTSVLLPLPETPVTATNVPSGSAQVDVPQVVLAGARDDAASLPLPFRRSAGIGTARSPRRNAPVIERGSASSVLERAVRDDLAAVLPGPGPDVDDPVRGPDRLLVVLDDEDRVAEVAQPGQRRDELGVVALVEADRRLVEDVQDAHQRRADLGREADPLRLAARQRHARPVEGQVVEPDVDEEPEPRDDLLEDLVGDRPLALGQRRRQARRPARARR